MNYMHENIKERLGLCDAVEVTSFQKDYSDCVKALVPDVNEYGKPVKEKIRRILGIPPQLFHSLENHCGLHQLQCEDGIEIETVTANDLETVDVPTGVDLLTVKLQKNELEKRMKNEKYRHTCYKSWRNSALPAVTFDNKKKKKELSAEEKVDVYDDTILTIQVYRPPRSDKSSRILPEIDQEFAVLGSQCLTELRDAITCTSDLSVPGEFSENPDMPQVIRAQDVYKSGFFYINNTFYNDMRDSANRDYSQVIMDWAAEKDRGVGPFDHQLMEETRFCDLKIELGYPYLYMHQGSCEHIIVFTDLRLLGPNDSCTVNHYPILQRVFPKKRNPCMVCKTYTSKWVTFKNERARDDPYFFCDICFRCFNYTSDGEKIGEFKAYPYVDKTATN